jgi:hypothetical protein
MALSIQNYPQDMLLVGGNPEYEDEVVTMDLTATQGTVTDSTTYPVATQATLTEKVTVDGGAEQTVTFTTAIDKGRAVSSNAWPVGTQDTLTEKITIDGGAEQTITFSGALTTAAHIAAFIDAHLTGGSAVVVGTNVVIYSDSTGPTSSVAIGTGTTDVTWSTPDKCNTADDVASQMNTQLTGCNVYVSSGHVVIESDTSGLSSTIDIGTGTCALAWGTPSDGTGKTGTIAKGTILARNTSSKKFTTYSDSGSTGENEPGAIMPYEETWTSTGDKTIRVLKRGTVAKADLVKHDDATAIDALVYDKLVKNTGVLPVTAVDLSAYDNA